jgi:hypothetical protein
MNPEILGRLRAFEGEGINLQQQLAVSVNQASSRKNLGNVLTNLFADEVLPYGTIGIGKKFASGALSNHQRIAQKGAAERADLWLDSITNYLGAISILTSSITLKGNGSTLIRKFNSAKNVTSFQKKISRGLKAIKQLHTCELVYNRDLDAILKEKRLQSVIVSRYKEMVREAKDLLKNYQSELESFLGAVERIEKGGIDAERQCLSSCRNTLENLIKEVSGKTDWKEGLKIIVPSKTRQDTIKSTHRFLSAYGAHGKTTSHDDAKSGLEQTMVAIRIILSQNKE